MARIDAIIVPTARPVAYLKEAAAAALALRCPLVTLHSGKWTSAQGAAAYMDPAIDLVAIGVPEGARLRLPELETSRLLAGTIFERRTDVSIKRNLALMLSHMLRWKRVVFLDDDIRVPNPRDLSKAAGLLRNHPAAGLGIGGFPNHSVVGHAFCAAGGQQETFISGRALAVDIKRNRSCFPNVYNDDWFFVMDGGRNLQWVATVGQVLQYPYDPYRINRARAEEFGDVLAEGMFGLLDQGKPASEGDLEHWRDFLAHRQQFIQQVRSMVASRAGIDPAERARMEEALTAALGRCARITPELCMAYMKALAIDQDRWQRHIQQIRRQPKQSRERALNALTVSGETPLACYTTTSPSAGEPAAARKRSLAAAAVPAWRPIQPDELQPAISSSPLAPAPRGLDAVRADEAEAEANRALARYSFDEAVALLETALALDPGREEKLRPDLNFISREPGESPSRLQWRRGVWLALAASSPFEPQDSNLVQSADTHNTPTSTPMPMSSTSEGGQQQQDVLQSKEKVAHSPEKLGEDLETAFIRLLERFFRLGEEDERLILDRLRRQGTGTQFGHDVQFDCTLANDIKVQCHVECKNYDRKLRTQDIADKILQMQSYWNSKKIDYFIIVTPRAGITNDLDNLVQYFNEHESMPFQIQVWGPEEAIDELFALEPAAYRTIYHSDPPPIDAEGVIDRWTGRIRPVLRLPAPLSAYLANAGAHCMPGEDRAHFEELFTGPIEVEAATPAGVPLGPLRHVLTDWVNDPARRRLLLVGEFGDGKSFAGYQLTRRLGSEYRSDPEGHFPLRLSLRDLRSAGNPQELLSRRLQTFGADVKDWFSLPDVTKTIVILDGFDEMSAQLDHTTVAENLRMLAECVRYFGVSKLLVTSRTHFFETNRDQARFLEQLEEPDVVRLAPLPRNKRSEHLEAYAKRHNLSGKFNKLRRLYDPIGLAAKPLFLQMIKETLPTLPDDHFDEITLYETSVRDSLMRKAELLEDRSLLTLRKETLEGMTRLLESLAVEILRTGGQPVDLRAFGGNNLDIARVLWKMSEVDAGAQQTQDARARLGVRSLLRPHPKLDEDEAWLVTFCHRSMSEYFVAQAIARALRNDYSTARNLLSPVILGHEIIRYITLLLNKGDDTTEVGRTLEALARSAVRGTNSGYVGGNAVTLAFRVRWQAPRKGWANLDLAYADLSGADLAGVDFSGSSLRYATLDNADLSDSDLTGCDLTGVRIEETAPVIDIAPGSREDSVLTCYGDGSIREWSLSGSRPVSRTLLDGLKALKTAAWGPYGDLVLVDGPKLSLWEIAEDEATKRNEFHIRNGTDHVRLARDMVSFTQAEGDQLLALSFDCQVASVNAAIPLISRGPVIFARDVAVSAPLGKSLVRISRFNSDHLTEVSIPVDDVIALDMRSREADVIHVILADGKGYAVPLRCSADLSELILDRQTSLKLHEGPILSTAFLSQGTIATGGADRSVMVCDWDHGQLRIAYQLKLTLRCVGIKIAGVQGDYERRALEALRHKAEESDQPAVDA